MYKSIFTLIIINIFLFEYNIAQPGGGGGLVVNSLYNQELESIKNKGINIDIQNFILDKNQIIQERDIRYSAPYNYNTEDYQVVLYPYESDDYSNYPASESDQRLIIFYKKDTMIVDFRGVIGENGAGHVDYMDSLVFKRGHYTFQRNKTDKHRYYYDFYNDYGQYLSNGLTPYTIDTLMKIGLVQYNESIDFSFFNNENLPSVYHYYKANSLFLLEKKTDEALEQLNISIQKNNGKRDCKTLYLLQQIYATIEDYEKSIDVITEAMNCKKKYWENESLEKNYRLRASLYTKIGDYENALKDYDRMVNRSVNKLNANITRAQFKADVLNDYNGAIDDLKKDIEDIPSRHLSDRPIGTSEYKITYFVLGNIYYQNDDIKNASYYWMRGLEIGYARGSTNNTVIHFDSIIVKHPKNADLYFCRALAESYRGPYLGWGEDSRVVFRNAISDIEKAKEWGLNDFKYHYYKATFLELLKKREEAYEEVSKAIEINNQDPRPYLLRSTLKRKLGLYTGNVYEEPDWLKFKELSAKWEFQK